MNHEHLLIASQNGKLYSYKYHKDKIRPVFELNSRAMGISFTGFPYYFVSDKSSIWKLDSDFKPIAKFEGTDKRLDFHHIKYIDGYLYVTCTGSDEIWRFYTSDLEFKDSISIKDICGLKSDKSLRGYNDYFHVNSISKYKDRYYVDLNHYYGLDKSGVLVLDNKFNLLREFEYGWETHGFDVVDGDHYALCGNSWKDLDHPKKAGLMVNGDIVFHHNPFKIFCKDFAINDTNIYIVGGDVSRREQRNDSNSYLFKLNRNFELLETRTFENMGQFSGCIVKRR